MGMVDRVARAIDPFAFDDWQRHFDYEMRASGNDTEAKAFADWTSGKRIEDAREKAIAAIEAMREPSADMIIAGVYRANGFASAGNRMCNGYRAMIDKAIQESGE